LQFLKCLLADLSTGQKKAFILDYSTVNYNVVLPARKTNCTHVGIWCETVNS